MDTNSRLFVYASLPVSIPLLAWNLTKSTRKIPLPPGPPADPLIGHLLRSPSENPEVVFHEWSKQYGDVIHLSVLGRSIVVLDSHQAAVDLLEKRSALYSASSSLFACRMGWDPDVVFLPYGQRFRKHRKLFHTYFMQKSCLQFQPVQLHNAHLLVHGLMKNEGNHNQLLARFASLDIALDNSIETMNTSTFSTRWALPSALGGYREPRHRRASHLTALPFVVHWHALRERQEEVDRVVGRDRLPTFENRDRHVARSEHIRQSNRV
ncbi:hypothetical protein EYR38_007442 [Pleurotus pulmonarius]|nr:hypothetical protein EYR38_007442 [Pleurotus pulmonarius]